MKKALLISIVVPIYNVQAYLERCINSLLSQDYENIEIILVNDGSTDQCGKICDDYAKKDNRIKAYHKANGGLSDARNYGMDKAGGEYILFVDSDDYILKNACSYLLDDAVKNNADIVIGNAKPLKPIALMERRDKCVRDSFSYHTIYSGKEYLLGCLKGAGYRIEVWRNLYSAEFLKKNNLHFEKGITHEDELFTPLALLAAERVVLSDLVFYIYDNARPASIMNSKSMSNKKAWDKLHIYETLWEIFTNVNPEILRKWLLDDWCIKYLYTVSIHNLAANKEFKAKKIKALKAAYTLKHRIRALIFAISPKCYCKIFR